MEWGSPVSVVSVYLIETSPLGHRPIVTNVYSNQLLFIIIVVVIDQILSTMFVGSFIKLMYYLYYYHILNISLLASSQLFFIST